MKKVSESLLVLIGFSAAQAAGSLPVADPAGRLTEAVPGILATDTLKWYDKVDYTAIGITGGGTLYWGVRFYIDAAHVGKITECGFYLHETVNWEQGLMTTWDGYTYAPYILIEQEYFDPRIHTGWYACSFDNTYTYSGMNLWITCMLDHENGEYPASVDDGPAVVGYGDWIYIDGSWEELVDYGLNYNWNIYAIAQTDVSEDVAGSLLELKVPTVSRGQINIDYTLPERCEVSLGIYDMTGKLVIPLKEGTQSAGSYMALISGLRPGGYIVNLVAGGESLSEKLMVTE